MARPFWAQKQAKSLPGLSKIAFEGKFLPILSPSKQLLSLFLLLLLLLHRIGKWNFLGFSGSDKTAF